MYQPETYAVALSFMIVSMLCWGSWANTVKLCPGYRFQLFYWDYVIGLLIGALAWGLSLGTAGSTGRPFIQDLTAIHHTNLLLALIGGIIFNVANLLLVAAIEIAGLAVAFPVGIGLALVVGAVSSYLLSPNGNPLMLFGGIVLVVGAIIFDAVAYRLRERERPAMSRRGVIISLVSGVLMGSFYPFVARSMSGQDAPGPYAVSFIFVVGVALCAIPFNYLLDAQTAGCAATRLHERVLHCALAMASLGNHWRSNLVHRRSVQLRCVTGAHRGAGGFLLYRPRGHHDFGLLGGIYLARIFSRSCAGEDVSLLDVCSFSCRAYAGCPGPHFLAEEDFVQVPS